MAMPCVGLDAWSAAMAEMRWPGPYMVKYAFDIDREMAIPLLRLHGPPLPGAVFKIGATGDISEEDISQWDRVDGTIAGPPCPPYSRIGARRGKKILERQDIWERGGGAGAPGRRPEGSGRGPEWPRSLGRAKIKCFV